MFFTTLNSEHLFDLPCHVYNKDRFSKYIACNDFSAKDAGFSKNTELVGLTDADLCWHESTPILQVNDKRVIDQATPQIYFESGIIANKGLMPAISFKVPLYSFSGKKVIGLLGLTSYRLNDINDFIFQSKISKVLSQELVKALLSVSPRQDESAIDTKKYYFSHRFGLSQREAEVLDLLIQGKRAKEIAHILLLSKRTVEHHIENIKDKMQVSSKYELIVKAISQS